MPRRLYWRAESTEPSGIWASTFCWYCFITGGLTEPVKSRDNLPCPTFHKRARVLSNLGDG